MPWWRNWQTRTTQNRVVATPCGFDSHPRHQTENDKMIHFTKHALEKFKTLKRHNFFVSKKQILEIITNPEIIDHSRLPLLIAQGKFDRTHVLRVVYNQERVVTKVITFYPGRRKQYEK